MPVYLLYGEDTFSSRQKLAEIKARFFDRNLGDINISAFEGEKFTAEQFQRAAFMTPFFSKKRLVIVYNFLNKGSKNEIDKITTLLSHVPEFTIVIFYEEGEVDQRLSLFKTLKKEKKTERCDLLKPPELIQWIIQQTVKEKGKILYPAAKKLAEMIGPDLWRLSLEIQKLVLYKNGETITVKDIEEMVKVEVDPGIFRLIDTLSQKNFQLALSIINDLVKSGQNESYILVMIAYQFRNLLIVKDLLKRQEPLTRSGLSSFVLSKTLEQTKNFSLEQLKRIYEKIVETDVNIKHGNLKPHLALDMLVAEIVS